MEKKKTTKVESDTAKDKQEVTAAPQPHEPNMHLIVFKVGGEEYGIRIEQVKEVTITPEITRMPKTPSFIRGVANIRGDIIAIMDLEERFGLQGTVIAESTARAHTYTLVIEAGDYDIGLLVREVPQSVTLPVSSIDSTPGIIQETGFNTGFMSGIAKLDSRMIIVLDIQKILNLEEISLLSGKTIAH